MNEFELIARGVIFCKNKILLCHAKGKQHYFFPGGHIEFGENAKAALEREIMEELGIKSTVKDFIGASENIYEVNGKKHHEMNMVFVVELETNEVTSREDYLSFEWIEIDKFKQVDVFPVSQTKNILTWLDTKEVFWS